MEHRSIYEQIAGRTDGTVYIGVVGPVRTGKSTFIKRFMEQLVLPNIENVYERERATDELPQSGSGRTIMTAEPKFVPNEAARISPDGKTTLRVRLIDSVGYMIPGAVGDTEDGKPRMVTTPWAPEELPMAQAAELGTKKVMEDHSSLGVVVTTDGTVTDIPREDYREAEARAITDMQKTGKPFVVLVNTQSPGAAPAEALCAQLRSEYGVQALHGLHAHADAGHRPSARGRHVRLPGGGAALLPAELGPGAAGRPSGQGRALRRHARARGRAHQPQRG